MKRQTSKLLAVALVVCLALTALAACSGQTNTNENSSSNTQSTAVDTSSWKTLADAIAFGGEPTTASWDDNYYVALFQTEDAAVRVVAKSEKGVDDKLMQIMPGSEKYVEELTKAVGNLELVSAEDVTSDKITQDELDALVGKTGQDLLDAGWTFSSYSAYGGDETTATFDKGYFCYDATFAVSVPEKTVDSDTEGESVKSAQITSIQCTGASNSAVDLSLVEQK